MTAQALIDALQMHASAYDAAFLQRFFKTAEGEYGAGDVFIGVRVPNTRAVCKQFKQMPIAELHRLLDSPVHEHRLAAVIIMTLQYPRATAAQQKALYTLYLDRLHAGRINNWDIIDVSAEHIIGAQLAGRDIRPLYTLARSTSVWERRVAILSCFHFIKHGDPAPTLELAELLLHDTHDLIQKAVGWQLREVGKRCDQQLLCAFLDRHAATMPRTMLRYAIERLSLEKRHGYMAAGR